MKKNLLVAISLLTIASLSSCGGGASSSAAASSKTASSSSLPSSSSASLSVNTKTVDLYFSPTNKKSIDLSFVNGVNDIPFLEMNELVKQITLLGTGVLSSAFALTVSNVSGVYTLKRENDSALVFDFNSKTLTYHDYCDFFNRDYAETAVDPMADAYGTYVADDGTGRILVADRHLGGTYETAYQAVGTILSINGTLSQAFFEPRYELLVYDLSTAITHAPTVSLNTVRNGFPTTEYPTATDETTPYWVSERFSCAVAYDSGGTASDPTLRCTYNEYFCTIANYKALNKESYPSEFTFTGYLVYGFKNCASLIFDSHTEA